MKYEKVADSIISVLNGLNYKYKMYNSSTGKRTSNPYDARYFFVSEPNLMLILDRNTNTLTIHKSSLPFNKFKPILQLFKNISRRYFINLEIQNYNSNFVPKDFSSDIHKKKSELQKPLAESKINYIKETYKNKNNTIEVYNNNNNNNNNNNTKYVLNSVNGIDLPDDTNKLTPYIVEHIDKHSKIDRNFIINLYKRYQKYERLYECSKQRVLTSNEKLLLKELNSYFN